MCFFPSLFLLATKFADRSLSGTFSIDYVGASCSNPYKRSETIFFSSFSPFILKGRAECLPVSTKKAEILLAK